MSLFKLPYDNSGVTVELRELVENGVDIWNFDYPSFYEGSEKLAFERKVIEHYYFRQIGQETPARWLHYFRGRIREIMPYYIQLYKSCELMAAIDDPFESYNLTEEYTEQYNNQETETETAEATAELNGHGRSETAADNTQSTSETASKTRRFSNTPQGAIENLDDYLTEATVESENTSGTQGGEQNSTTTTQDKTNTTTTGDIERTKGNDGTITRTMTRKGNIGVQPLGKEVQALRESFLNVDMMIINELKDLFLQVY